MTVACGWEWGTRAVQVRFYMLIYDYCNVARVVDGRLAYKLEMEKHASRKDVEVMWWRGKSPVA